MKNCKYLVLKHEDLSKYLSTTDRNALLDLISRMNQEKRLRNMEKLPKTNYYLVSNTDEGYAHEVFGIMHKNGHTPCNDCATDPSDCHDDWCPWYGTMSKARADRLL